MTVMASINCREPPKISCATNGRLPRTNGEDARNTKVLQEIVRDLGSACVVSSGPYISTPPYLGSDRAIRPVFSLMSPYIIGNETRRRYILYLEPDNNNPLYALCMRYFDEARATLGPSEAQQYHPHCSVTGFFENSCQNPNVIAAVCKLIEDYLRSGKEISVSYRGLEYIASEVPSVRLALNTIGLRELADQLVHLGKTLGVLIRPKPVDHISLAYVSSFPLARGPENPGMFYFESGKKIFEYCPAGHYELARRILGPYVDLIPDTGGWKLILFEETHSNLIYAGHSFNPISEWKLFG